MIPVKFMRRIIQKKNRAAIVQTAFTSLTAVVIFGAHEYHASGAIDWTFCAIVFVGSFMIGRLVIEINRKQDRKFYLELNDQIDRESDELVKLIHDKQVFKKSEIIPICEKLVERYEDDE